MISCDAIVVGGGPGGSSCARRLREGGMHVVVLDKRQFPRNKPCAGWITPQVVEALGIALDEYGSNHVCQPIRGFRCGMIRGRHVEVRYPDPVSYGIRRCEFDTYLLQRSGAECHFQVSVSAIERHGGHWVINGQFSAPLLVGAGGHFCPVARRLGARGYSGASVVASQEIEFTSTGEDDRVAADTPEIYFCSDLLGYGWCFRKGGYLNIGLGRTDPSQLAHHVSQFCVYLKETGRVNGALPPRFVGHAYQLYERSLPKLVDDGVLLVGDAAGLAYPQSGEGIRPAIESGLMAAEVLLRSADDLSLYERRVLERFGQPRRQGAADYLPAAWLQAIASRLLEQRWFCRHIVVDRWFLRRHQAALGSGSV